MSKRAARIAALWLGLSLAWPCAASAASGYALRKVALAGEAAPGTSDTFATPSAVAMNPSGDVAFVSSLSSSPTATGGWVEIGGVLALRMHSGDPAPDTGGSYSMLAGFPQLDASGGLALLALVSGGSSPRGVFLDAGSGDSALLLSGAAAPPPVGGTLSAGLADLQPFGYRDGVLLFRSGVSGGSASSGLFRRSAVGSVTVVALVGDAAPGAGGATYSAFTHPSLDAFARPAFCASLVGGSAARGLFADTGAGLSARALAGSAAPGTGGGSFTDFLYPAGAGGAVAFLAQASGGAASGGVFLDDSGIVPVAVEHQIAPGTGGGTLLQVDAPPAIDGYRNVSFSASLTGGSATGGIFRYDADTAALAPVAISGESVPGVSSPLSSFGYVSAGRGGAVAFAAKLADGRDGVFVATPVAVIPALPFAWGVGAALGLAALARAQLRRARPAN
ncbi:MAG TPA: choice-of-anchor tandem repeat NxxGxxAF-containing protein [Myxococcota bacterium]|nr:choice-of-anchor tandem repeat NxxGxxAF-containing protein [Myxococcota bacterium]